MEITSKSYLSLYFEKDIVEIDDSKFNITNDINENSHDYGQITEIIICKPKEFYIPNKKLFTKKTLELFEIDFKDYDFNEAKIKNVFYEAIGTTLEKDDCEKIYIKSYNYLKKVLNSKLEEAKDSNTNVNIKKTKFHNFDETYTNYSQDDLNELILLNQKKKYG